MNAQSKEYIMEQVKRHYQEALKLYPADRIVGVFLQGSQNYGLGLANSDIDTKCIVVPTLEDLIFNRKPVSTTHVLDNDEHLDAKDIRLYMQCFRKQNLNFVEILFTEFKIVNPIYNDYWNELIINNEQIARYNPVGAVKTMKGIAYEKFHAMEHRYPSKIEILDRWNYDGKQLHHLLRVEEYLRRYIDGESYAACLKSQIASFLKGVKKETPTGFYFTLEEARQEAITALTEIDAMYIKFIEQHQNEPVDEEVEELLNKVQKNIMKLAIELELRKED